jgi:DNA-binding MarR family transcriptional regulator
MQPSGSVDLRSGDRHEWRGILMRASLPLNEFDRETKANERPGDHKGELRLWLRMLTCATLIEREVRQRLREEFQITLPRFDLMAQLEKSPTGMTVGEVSQRLMVSNGNVTTVVTGLVEEGLVDKRPAPHDKRVQIISLTAAGRKLFRIMAARHEEWIAELLAGLSDEDVVLLMIQLKKTKASIQQAMKSHATDA